MSKGVTRNRTMRKLTERIMRFGSYHPATFAAYARAHVAWEGRVKPPPVAPVLTHDEWGDLCHAYTTADLRARGQLGHSNQRERRYWRDRASRFNRTHKELLVDRHTR